MTIETSRGEGFSMPEESTPKARELIAQAA